MRFVYAFLLSVLTVGFLSACSSNISNGGYVEDGQIFVDFSVEPVSDVEFGFDVFERVPFVTDVSGEGFVVVDGGSSSCPNVIGEVMVGDAEGSNVVSIRYAVQDGEVACTDDFRVSGVRVVFNDLVLVNVDDLVFELNGVRVDVVE